MKKIESDPKARLTFNSHFFELMFYLADSEVPQERTASDLIDENSDLLSQASMKIDILLGKKQ